MSRLSAGFLGGAWIDTVKPQWAEKLIGEGETPGPDAPPSPALEDLWLFIATNS